MIDHECYELLCALAATGQLDALEEADFDEHRMHCTACRNRLQEMTSIGAQLQWNAALETTSTSMPAGSLDRFRMRALREGIAPRSAPVTAFAFYARAAAATLTVIVAFAVFMPHGNKAAERSVISNISDAASIASGQSPQTGVYPRMPRPPKLVRARFGRHGCVRRSDAQVIAASRIAKPLPQMIAANNPYFWPRVATKVTATGYPALSESQIVRLGVFRTLGESASGAAADAVRDARPIDIALAGKVFDFADQIRQLRFQLPAAQ